MVFARASTLNRATSHGANASVTYDANPGALQGPSTHCWYVDGLSNGSVWARGRLYFSNGQNVSAAAIGIISIYKSSITSFVPTNNIHVVLTNNIPNVFLGLGDINGNGAMDWDLTVSLNTSFIGQLSYVQLIDRYWTWDTPPPLLWTPITHASITGTYWLDNNVPYAIPGTIDMGTYYTPPSQIMMHFTDGPQLDETFYSFADFTDRFKTYVRFQPDTPGSIPVTIGRVDWGWHGRGTLAGSAWFLQVQSITQPILNTNDNSFPIWQHTFTNP